MATSNNRIYHLQYSSAQIAASVGKGPIVQLGDDGKQTWWVWSIADMAYRDTGVVQQTDATNIMGQVKGTFPEIFKESGSWSELSEYDGLKVQYGSDIRTLSQLQGGSAVVYESYPYGTQQKSGTVTISGYVRLGIKS